MKKPKLLIAGGGHSDVPLINAGRALGFHVITTGNRAEDIGHAFADEVRLADFSDAAAMLALARDLRVDAICPSCNDFSAVSSAYVAKQLGLPGHDSLEVAQLIHHKDRYRKFAKQIGIPTPKAVGCESIGAAEEAISNLRYPLMIKPVDLTGGKGITRVEHPAEALAAARVALSISKAKRIVVEEFISGSRHGFSAILQNGRVAFYFVDDEHYHLSPYLVSAASTPSSCSAQTVSLLVGYSELVAKQLRLVDGIFHVQFIQPDFGDPVIIEICRRPPGDLYVELVRHATGAPYSEWIVRAFAGLPMPNLAQMDMHRSVIRHCLMAESEGEFTGFDFDLEVEPAIFDRMIWGKEGDRVFDAKTHKFGIVFVDLDELKDRNSCDIKLQKHLKAKII